LSLVFNNFLHRFVTDRSDTAFGELVNHCLEMVFSAALRQVRDPASHVDSDRAGDFNFSPASPRVFLVCSIF
jgi:hypothetical protein